MMKYLQKAQIVVLWLIVLLPVMGWGEAYYVSIIGDDNNPGTMQRPFKTIEEARDAIRQLKQEGKFNEPVDVFIRKGTYFLDKPIKFTKEDSGTSSCPITYQAYEGEKVTISGGKILNSTWEQHSGGIYKCNVGDSEFRSLWVDGVRATRAKEPDEDPTTDYLDFYISAATPDTWQAMGFSEGDIDANWTNLNTVEIQFMREFTSARKPIASYDGVNNAVWFSKAVGSTFCRFFPGNRYWVENVFEGLDEPGEWYLNTNTNELYYYPVGGKNPDTSTIITGNLGYSGSRLIGTLVHLGGSAYVEFRGLTFSHGDWYISSNGWQGFESEFNEADGNPGYIGTGPAVFVRSGSEGVQFVDCTFTHIGGYALHIYGHDVTVAHCTFSDIGASAIHVSASPGTSGYVATYNITIVDNTIKNYGVVFPAGKGIIVERAHDVLVTHNSVSNGGYMGIQMGGGGETDLQYSNTVTYNDVFNVCKLLHDAAGIYGGGTQTDSVFSHNKIHDIVAARSAIYDDSGGYGKGLYLDEDCDNIVVEKNWVYRVPWGILLHLTKNDIVRNNVFADISGLSFVWFSGSNDQITQNIYYNTQPVTYLYKNPAGDLDYNLFYNTDEEYQATWDAAIDNLQTRGFERNSLEKDPLFVDFPNDNFNLMGDSPAFTLGFEPIDMSNVGPRFTADPDPDPQPEPDPEAEPEPELIEPEDTSIPTKTELTCFNNIFNPSKGEDAIITIELDRQSHVKVVIYDSKGREIKTIVNEEKTPGFYRIQWDGKDDRGSKVGSGIYLIHMKVGGYKKTRKIAVIK